MYVRNKLVNTITIEEALNKSINYLQNISNKPSILVVHNGDFDFRFLIRDSYRYNFDLDLKNSICGFVDSLKLIKSIIKRPLYNLDILAREFVADFNPARTHFPIWDVRFLKKILRHIEITYSDLIKNTLTFHEYVIKTRLKNKNKT